MPTSNDSVHDWLPHTVLGVVLTGFGWLVGLPHGVPDWRPYYLQAMGPEGRPYLTPPWLEPGLDVIAGLGFSGSYLLVSGVGMALLTIALFGAPARYAMVVLLAQLIALGTGQITPVLAGLALLGLRGGRRSAGWLGALAVAVKPTIGAPLCAVLISEGRAGPVVTMAATLGALLALFDTGPWFERVRSARETLSQLSPWTWQWGTLRWLPRSLTPIAVGVAFAFGVSRTLVSRVPRWAVWLVGVFSIPWLFHYDALGLGAIALVLWDDDRPIGPMGDADPGDQVGKIRPGGSSVAEGSGTEGS